MTRDEQEYYEAHFEMFASKGWQHFLEDLQDAKTLIVGHITTSPLTDQQYNFLKGDLSRINLILGYKDALNNAYDSLKEEEK